MKKMILRTAGFIVAIIVTDTAAMFEQEGLNIPEMKSIIQFKEYFENRWKNEKPKIIEIVEHAINNNQTVDKPEYSTWGYTPLCSAVEGDDLEFVRFLLKNGADVNDEIWKVHSSKPIFFARTLEMVKLLQGHGAKIDFINKSSTHQQMDFLHWAMRCNSEDDRLIKYALEQGLDAKSVNGFGGNLWHSLVFVSARHCPEERLLRRAGLLQELGINPYYEDNHGKSAIDMIKEEVASETQYLNDNIQISDFAIRKSIRNKLQKLLDLMEKVVPEELRLKDFIKKIISIK